MGVTFGVVCEKCGVEGPEVGDFGYIGAPSLERRKRRGGLQTFGFIYEGLEAIGVVTEEIEAFKTFLDEHRGHPIALYGDGEAERDTAGDAAPARTKPFGFTRRFRPIFHELHCETCHETRRSSESTALRPFEPFAVSVDRSSFLRTGRQNRGQPVQVRRLPVRRRRGPRRVPSQAPAPSPRRAAGRGKNRAAAERRGAPGARDRAVDAARVAAGGERARARSGGRRGSPGVDVAAAARSRCQARGGTRDRPVAQAGAARRISCRCSTIRR